MGEVIVVVLVVVGTSNAANKGGGTVTEPPEATASDVYGYLLECGGPSGNRSSQEVAALLAVRFGSEYHCRVIAQSELDDRDEMNTLWRDALTGFILSDGVLVSAPL